MLNLKGTKTYQFWIQQQFVLIQYKLTTIETANKKPSVILSYAFSCMLHKTLSTDCNTFKTLHRTCTHSISMFTLNNQQDTQ